MAEHTGIENSIRMTEDFKKINMQIAAFMVVSLALSATVSAIEPTADNSLLSCHSRKIETPMVKYGIPDIPKRPRRVVPPTLMYAAPDIPIIQEEEEVAPLELYAVPDIPVIEKPIQHVALYAAPEILHEKRIFNDAKKK